MSLGFARSWSHPLFSRATSTRYLYNPFLIRPFLRKLENWGEIKKRNSKPLFFGQILKKSLISENQIFSKRRSQSEPGVPVSHRCGCAGELERGPLTLWQCCCFLPLTASVLFLLLLLLCPPRSFSLSIYLLYLYAYLSQARQLQEVPKTLEHVPILFPFSMLSTLHVPNFIAQRVYIHRQSIFSRTVLWRRRPLAKMYGLFPLFFPFGVLLSPHSQPCPNVASSILASFLRVASCWCFVAGRLCSTTPTSSALKWTASTSLSPTGSASDTSSRSDLQIAHI